MRIILAAAVLCICVSSSLFSQQKVDPRDSYHRVLCVVPLTGTGTWNDPKRPLFAPAQPNTPTSRSGILAYAFQSSDDGNFALVEFVAADRAALQTILTDKRTLKYFEKGKSSYGDIAKEFKKYRKDFDFTHFGARVQ